MTMRLLLCCAVVAGDAKRRRLEGRRRRRECLAAAPQVPARRVVAADLVREAREALRLPYHDPSRYFSVEQDPAHRRRRRRPAFYVHEGVPGTFKELCAYRADKSAGVASRLVRYALDRAALEAATRDAKRALACAAS